jgi:hypothetical protein
MLLENLFIIIGDYSTDALLIAIPSNVMSLVEALVALLLYYLPPAADQLGDWGVKHILVIIITVSYYGFSKLLIIFIIRTKILRNRL